MTVAPTALVCRELRLRQFRNLAELSLTLPADGAAVIGDNGSGKTNLLEALYYLEIFRSFRSAPDEQLVRFGADVFHIRGRFEDPATGQCREITAAYEQRTRRKRITIDGIEQERMGDAIGRVGVVVFSPSDVVLVAGPPAERRRFLDIVLSLSSAGYLAALQRYRHVLRQRNALLRSATGLGALEVWDGELVRTGARVMATRAAWVAARGESFAERYAAMGDTVPPTLRYRPGVPLQDGDAREAEVVAQAFRKRLAQVRRREVERGMTLAGPHRDDLGILVDAPGTEVDLRDYGSGGQLRTAAIALRMVEAESVRQAHARPPMILLDDVFAELDPGRSSRILRLLDTEERGQVILTAPKESDVELRRSDFVSSLAPWRIAGGVVTT